MLARPPPHARLRLRLHTHARTHARTHAHEPAHTHTRETKKGKSKITKLKYGKSFYPVKTDPPWSWLGWLVPGAGSPGSQTISPTQEDFPKPPVYPCRFGKTEIGKTNSQIPI